MSDCSTQAMMPKERRTCGNCNNCDFFDMECSYIEEDETHRKVTMDTPACADWERRVLTDEECYERLAQVARSMYRVIAMFETRFEAEHYSPSEWAPERGAITKSTKEQLEALGVSVDDGA